HQPLVMCCLHQGLEMIGVSITAVRSVRQHAVIAPVAPAGKVSQRHQLNRGHAEISKVIKQVLDTLEGSFGAKSPDVKFVNDGRIPGLSLPRLVVPIEMPGIDDLAWTMNIVRLESGCG